MINNPTEKEWRIKPTISTSEDKCKDYFRGIETLIVPPKGNAEYQVSYYPLTMTTEKEVSKVAEEVKEKVTVFHEASLFFPLPDGNAEFYKLFGQSNKPSSIQTIEVSVSAKKPKYISIKVENWLKTSQRFSVKPEIEGGADKTTFVRGANTFDVQGNSSKEYKLNFLTYKAGVTHFKVTFLNEATKEYIFYTVKAIADEPGIQSSIELAASVRETTSQMIIIENPTDEEVKIAKSEFVYKNENISLSPDGIIIPPQSERGFEISYRPLIVREETEELILNSVALGTYKYELILKGLVSTAQRSLHFKCALGADLMQQFKFKHYLNKPTTYAIKCEDMVGHATTCFKVEQPNIQAPASDNINGAEVAINIRFEPNIIGESRGIVKLTSPENIEYT
jgi:hydrocephalus-inducing protein